MIRRSIVSSTLDLSRGLKIVIHFYLGIQYIAIMPLQFISGYIMGSRNAARAAGMSASASQFSAQPQSKVLDIQDRLDRMTLVMEAMWSLMVEHGLSNEDLTKRIEELDASDGAIDGRKVPTAAECPKCGAMVGRGAGHCQFCGHEMGEASPFVQ